MEAATHLETGRRRSFRTALLVAVGAVAVAIVGALLLGGGDEAEEAGTPREVSVQQLQDFARDQQEPIYWAGEVGGTKLELTETSRGQVYVRYLPERAAIGDEKPAYTAIGSYPRQNALEAVRRASRRRGAVTRRVRGGGLAVWNRARPTSVYVAFPRSNRLVEVYHPRARTAQELALSGKIARLP
jgi:hypothetical protein